jgi:hypothetical protein
MTEVPKFEHDIKDIVYVIEDNMIQSGEVVHRILRFEDYVTKGNIYDSSMAVEYIIQLSHCQVSRSDDNTYNSPEESSRHMLEQFHFHSED